jgi:hypothetical protein
MSRCYIDASTFQRKFPKLNIKIVDVLRTFLREFRMVPFSGVSDVLLDVIQT